MATAEQNQLATKNATPETIENALIRGDLKNLSVPQRLEYYKQICESLGLNPLTQPFGYHEFNGKVVLYARKDATEQLRKIHTVSITKLDREVADGLVIFTAHAKNATGREDIGTGAVAIENLKGENRANAIMKAETKAKRRVTLSICGLGLLDESELDSIPELPIATSLETKALPEAVTAPSAVNSAPATEGVRESRPVSGQVVETTTVPCLPSTPVIVQGADLPHALPQDGLPTAKDLDTVAADPSLAPATTTESTTSVKPSQEQFEAYKKRAGDLRVILEKSGLKPSAKPPLSTGAKLVKYFTQTAGVATVADLTVAQWDTIFSVVDGLAKTNPGKAIELIEEKLK